MRSVGSLLGFIVLLGFLRTAVSQTALGTITGAVRDEVGNEPVAAALAVLSDSSGIAFESLTDKYGAFTFRDLPPGTYGLSLSLAKQCRAVEIRSIVLPVSGLIIQNVTMRKLADIWQTGRDRAIVSGAQQTVVPFYGPDVDLSRSAVTEQSPPIRSQFEPSLSRDVSADELRFLPLLGRDPYALLVLQPGVTSDLSTVRGLSASANGQRPSSSSFLLDGFQNNDYLSTGLFAVLPPEATEEYRLSTANFSAEFGGTSGYIANAVSISGGNALRGQLFADITNLDFDAVDPQENLSGGPAPRQQISTGATLGMPLIKSRLFEAASFWYDRDSHSISPCAYQNPPGICASKFPTELFLQNIPSSSLLSQVFGRYPGPIASGPGISGSLVVRAGLSAERLNALERLDWNSADHRHHSFARLIVDRLFEPQFIWSPSRAFRSGLDRDQTGIGYARTDTLGANWTDEFRIGFSQDFIGWNRSHPEIPYIATSPVGSIGSPAGYMFHNRGRNLETAMNLARSEGTHSVQFGTSYLLRTLSAEFSPPSDFNYLFFPSPSNPMNISNLLAGIPSEILLAIARAPSVDGEYMAPNLARDYRYIQVSAYVQDSFRLTSRLLIHAGLRYDFFGPPYNTGSTEDTLVTLGSGSSIQARLSSATLTQGRRIYDSDFRGFGPRFGLVYNVDRAGSLLLRASYGIFYDRPFDNLWLNVSLNSVIGATSAPNSPVDYLADSATVTRTLASLPNFSIDPRKYDLSFFQPHFRNPYAQGFFGGIQKSIDRSMLVEVEYSGSLGRELLTTDVINRIGSTCVSAIACRFNNSPGLNSDIDYRANQGLSDYHALVSSFLIRSRSLSATFSYTWSHAIDNQSEPLAGDTGDLTAASQVAALTTFRASFARQFDSSADRGNSDFDQRHVFSSYLTWSMPNIERWPLARDWILSGVTSFRTGLPFTVFAEDSQPVYNPRANILNPALAVAETLYTGGKLLLNPAEFSQPPPGQIGNGGRNAFTGPGAYNFDASISRTFRIPRQERWVATFRVDGFNVLNHANLSNPTQESLQLGSGGPLGLALYGRTESTTGLGMVTPISETARQIHLLFRLEF